MRASAVLWITLWAATVSRVGGDGDDDSGGGVGYPQEDERFERLYEKLELLNALEADGGVEEAAAAERSERQLEMVAALAAAAPRLVAEQLEELLTDLRDATAAADDDDSASAAAAAADGAGADYADDDWHEIEDDYPMDDEEGAGEAVDVEEEAWSEPPLEGDADTASEEERLRRAALAHWKRVMRGASCAEPTPRVLCAQDVHPHAGKIYLPQCAVLHRCGREAGCCHDAALQCAPLHRHVRVVYLPFYVLTVESSTNSQERLPFVNHTRCGCVNRTTAAEAEEAERAALRGARASVPRSRPAPPPARRRDVAGVDTTPAGGFGAGMPRDDDSTAPPRAGLSRVVAAPAQSAGDRDPVTRGPPEYTRRCSCPRGFTATSAGAEEVAGAALEVVGEGQGRGECRCECRERDCARLSKGKEHFGLRDRLCVKRAQCAAPRCEFGPYNRALGRCPRRRDPPPPPPPHTAHHRFTSRLL